MQRVREALYTDQRLTDMVNIRNGQYRDVAKTNQGLRDAPMRAWENFGQLGAVMAELFGKEGAVQDYTQNMDVRRLEATGGDPDVEQAADLGEAALLMAPVGSALRALKIGGRLLAPTRTLTGAVARTAAVGAGSAALGSGASETAETPGDALASRAWASLVGGGIPALAGTVAGTRAAVDNFFTRLARSADQNDALQKELRNALNVGPLTTSQRTGSPVARQFEMLVAGGKAQNFFNRQFERFAAQVDALRTSFGNAGRDPSALGTAWNISKAWQKQKGAAISAATTLYGQKLSQVTALAQADPAKFPVPFNNLADTAGKWSQESGEVWWRKLNPDATRIPEDMAGLDRYLQNIKGNPALSQGLDIPELLRIRKNLNAQDRAFYEAIQGGGDVSGKLRNQHNATREVIRALDDDIDAFLKSNPPDRPGVQALKEFQSANKDYRDFWELQRFMSQSATGQMFGFKIGDDPEKALRTIAGMEPAQQKILVNTLRNADPDTLLDLRRGLVDGAFHDLVGANTGPASRGRVDPDKFAKAILDQHGRVIGSEIFSPTQYAKLKQAMSTVKIMAEAPVGITSIGRSTGVEGPGMAIVSRSGAFLARVAIRLGAIPNIEERLLTEEGLRSLNIIRDTSLGGKLYGPNEVARAIAKLAAIAGVTPEQPDGQ